MDFEDFDIEERGRIFFAILSLSYILYYYFNDAIIAWASQQNPLLALMAYIFFSNLAYPIIIAGFTTISTNRFAGFFGSILLAISLDLSSIPHYITTTGLLPKDLFATFSTDVTIYNSIPFIQNMGAFSAQLLYIGVPIVLTFIALQLMGATIFTETIEEKLGF